MNGSDRYILKCDTNLLKVSREILYSQIGVKESGLNSGPMIKKYLSSVFLREGNPYCAAGQFYCFYEAANILHVPLESIPIARTGLANGIYASAQKRGIKTKYTAMIDDLIVWKYANSNSGHIERIVGVGLISSVTTIGFNTGGNNPREGDGVKLIKRSIKGPLGRMQIRGLIGFNK